MLFVRRNPRKGGWISAGERRGVERYGPTWPILIIPARLPEFWLVPRRSPSGRTPSGGGAVGAQHLGRQLDGYSRSGTAAMGLVAPTPILHRLRLRKAHELERMRQACGISAEAHELARQMTRPGMNESEVQAAIEAHFRARGARGPAYGSIVAGGDNACVLHYTANTAPCRR